MNVKKVTGKEKAIFRPKNGDTISVNEWAKPCEFPELVGKKIVSIITQGEKDAAFRYEEHFTVTMDDGITLTVNRCQLEAAVFPIRKPEEYTALKATLANYKK